MNEIETFISHLNEVIKIAESVVKNSQARVASLGIIDAYIEVELIKLELYLVKICNARREFIISHDPDFADEIIEYHTKISEIVNIIIKRIDVLLKN